MADVLERDAGFCSGGDEDDMEAEDGIHSPTDASEDSVDVKVQPISLRNRNKRKCAEPRKLDADLPAKKRKIDLSGTKDVEQSSRSPFRPWSASPPPRDDPPLRLPPRILLKSDARGPAEFNVISVPRLPSSHRPRDLPSPLRFPPSYSSIHQDEPLSLVSKRKDCDSQVPRLPKDEPDDVRLPAWPTPSPLKAPPLARPCPATRTKFHSPADGDRKFKTKTEDDNKFRIDSLLSSAKAEGSPGTSTSRPSQGGQQRNYKNMTRERRIEANARERTRVHTISAAFDTLRHSIPAYSHNQKLSKLSVLRIACSYIVTLSRLAGQDYTKDQAQPDLSACVDNVSRTIQTEGKIRKKKED